MTADRSETPLVGQARPAYRPDIDGLRAIAVLAVVGFHAFPSLVTGGFAGVDVFFVISGFLISSLIGSGLARGDFSFVEFYSRRIRRIFPALLAILIAGGALGWLVLPPDEYKQLGRHIAGGAGFVSNFVLLGESGYFDNSAITKPLLHLWSLGIEEQFYVVWPLLLWLAWKLRWNLLATTAAIGAASFLTNVVTAGVDPTEAFYLPQCRIWELMAGSALAMALLRRQGASPDLRPAPDDSSIAVLRNTGTVAGVTLIAAGFFLLVDDKLFPGIWPVLPVLGTLLVVAAGAQAGLNRVILSHPVLVWFGLISYPLYLWHWLLLSFARLIEYAETPPAVRIGLVLASIVLAWLTYRFIERPIRFGRRGMTVVALLAGLMAIVGAAGYGVYAENGFSSRFKDREAYLNYFDNSPPDYRYLKEKLVGPGIIRYECDFWNADQYFAGRETVVPRSSIAKHCYERDPRFAKAVFIWGDSHAQALYVGLKDNLPPDWQILQVTASGCIPNIDSTQPSKTSHCAQANWFAVKAIGEARPDVVVLAQNVGHDAKSFAAISARLTGLGVRKVILVGPSPHWSTDLYKIIANRLWTVTPQRTTVGIDRRTIERNRALASSFKQSESAEFVNLMGLLCNDEGCLTYLGTDRMAGITTYDRAHLTPVAADYVAKQLLVEQIVGGTPVR